ncbi:MAG TPA: hypothetical protein VLJ60_08835 [bacterium]|nr:hypothetical protein [bacterium]
MPDRSKKDDLLDVFDELEEVESGVVEEEEFSAAGDLDEDIDINRSEKVAVPEMQPFDRALNSDDLVDDIPEMSEDNDPEPVFNTEESFAPSKSVSKKKKTMQGVAIIAGAVLLLIVMFVPEKSKKSKKDETDTKRINTDEVLREMKQYSSDDLRRQQERKTREDHAEQPLPSSNAVKTAADPRRTPSSSGTGGGYSKNAQKDEEILAKYENVDPSAASGGSASGGLSKLSSLPARSGKGGLNIISSKESENKDEKLNYFNTELKAALKFGIRSSGGTSVVAVLRESKGEFPEGTVFYGNASFNNRRTFVNFTHAVVNDRKILLDGRAMMGKDPGIPSEVTEIAGDNANSSLKSGALGVAGKVADNALSRVTGGATSGVLSEPTADLQKQQEQEKKQYDYYVPANTVFTIYVY